MFLKKNFSDDFDNLIFVKRPTFTSKAIAKNVGKFPPDDFLRSK